MEIKTMDAIFNIHAFHQGEHDKPFAMVRSDFRNACRDIEQAAHKELIQKYNRLLVQTMKGFGWDSIYAIEIIDEMRKELRNEN